MRFPPRKRLRRRAHAGEITLCRPSLIIPLVTEFQDSTLHHQVKSVLIVIAKKIRIALYNTGAAFLLSALISIAKHRQASLPS